MTIERIFTRAAPGGPQTEHTAVRIVAGSGIEGDRHFGEFTVGGLRFRGAELCEPCLGLGEKLSTPTLTAAQAVKRLVAKAGLRAYALSSGELALGAVFQDAA